VRAVRHGICELDEVRIACGQRGGYSQGRFIVDERIELSRRPHVETEISTQARLPVESKLDCIGEAPLLTSVKHETHRLELYVANDSFWTKWGSALTTTVRRRG
jgi:hypothetical protein